jgi:hypothetical protein
MLDLRSLENAFARISQIGKGESEVEVDGVRVVLRTLLPEEDVAVQRYARGEGEDETLETLNMVERYKRATIAYAVVQVNELDLRGVTTIPTGEVLPNGVPVQMPKVLAVRRIVDSWSAQATTILFQRYADLIKQVEDETNAKVKYDTSNIDAEIERLNARIDELRRIKTVATPTNSASQVEAVREVNAAARPSPVGIADTPTSPMPRQRVQPTVTAPPPPVAPEVVSAAPEVVPDQMPDVMNSFGEATEEEVAAEMARISRARSRMETPEPIPVPHQRVPPHLAAAQLAQPLASATQVDSVNGLETFRLPATVVTDRGRPVERKVSPASVNHTPNMAPTNPNFKGKR